MVLRLMYEPQELVDTSNLSNEEWLSYRRRGIGGSDAAAILGISPWRTARDLYYDKLNVVKADMDENWVALEMGHLLEDLVARIFAKKTGLHIFQRKVMFQHPLYPWMLADLDYLVELPDGSNAILEIKTTKWHCCRPEAMPFWRSRRQIITPEKTGGTTARRSFRCTTNLRVGIICQS